MLRTPNHNSPSLMISADTAQWCVLQHSKAKRQRVGQDGQDFFTSEAPVEAGAQQEPRRRRS